MSVKINSLNVVITTPAGVVVLGETEHLTGIRFDTLYPGGLYGSFQCFVPRRITRAWGVRMNYKLQLYNGLTLVWEGQITALTPSTSPEGEGVSLTAIGYWGNVLMRRYLRKPWCDTRVGQEIWVKGTTETGAEKCTFDHTNRLMFVPKNVVWATSDYAVIFYTPPTGQTIKRVSFSYDLQEGAQNWTLGSNTNAEGLWSVSASGTGTQNITLATPRPFVYFFLQAGAIQTPAADGTIYGKITNIKVYTETGAINLTEISKDIRAIPAELSADERLVGSNTFALEPFIADPPLTLADILTDAASYGDASFNSWAVGVRGSNLSSDGKPILFVEQQPVLTDYDYAIRVDDVNVNGPLAFSQNIEDVRNYVIAEYQTLEGYPAFVTPDDDATLKDTTSIAAYGERHEFITVQTTDVAKAKNVAKRILAARKDPQWRADGQITVTGYIRDRSGSQIPASQIQAGKRLRIEDWLNDLSGTGLTFLITSTEYTDASETCALGVGQVDDLATYMSRLSRGVDWV